MMATRAKRHPGWLTGRLVAITLSTSVLLIVPITVAHADPVPAAPGPAATASAVPDPEPGPPPNSHLPPPGTPGNGGPRTDTRLPAPQQVPPANPPGAGPAWWDIPGQVEQAIDTWLGDLAQAALTPILTLFGTALLASPDVTTGRVAELWQTDLVIADSLYVLLIVVGAILVMGHETVQTRYGVRQIAPRMVFGFLAANLSLQVIGLLNGAVASLAAAIWGTPIDPAGIGNRLLQIILTAAIMPDGATQAFLIILALVICALAVAVLVSCALRTAGLMVLAALAPLPLVTHALPGLDGAARLWWRCLGAVFAIQLLQTLTFVLMLQTIFDPDGATLGLFPTSSGLTDLLVCAALMLILLKIPSWALRIALGHTPRTFVGSVLRTAAAAAIGYSIGVPGAASPRYLLGRAAGQAAGRAVSGYMQNRTSRLTVGTVRRSFSPASSAAKPAKAVQPLGGQLRYGNARGSHRSGQMALFPMPRGHQAPMPGPAPVSASMSSASSMSAAAPPASGPGWRQPALFTTAPPLTKGVQEPLFASPPPPKAQTITPASTPVRAAGEASGAQRGLFPRDLGRPATLTDQMKVNRSRRRVGDSLHVKFLAPPPPSDGDDAT